jgi:phosphonate transport system permease protein
MSGAIRLNDITAVDIAEARARLPRVFGRPWPERALRLVFAVAAITYLGYLHWLFDFARIFSGLDRLWVVLGLMVDWSQFESWDHAEILTSLMETVAMAFLGTVMASVVALPLGFLGARNVIPSRVFRFFTRRVFDVFRGLDQLIWALAFVRAMGLGPIAGILAIFVSDTGVLAKLYSEAVENAERGPIDGIRATGAAEVVTLRLGLRLSERIQINAWDQVAYIIVLILIAVAAIDFVSKWLRGRLISGR